MRGCGGHFRGFGFDGAELRDGGLIEQAEDYGEAFFWQLLSRDDVADDGGGGFEAQLPAGAGASSPTNSAPIEPFFRLRRHGSTVIHATRYSLSL